MLLPIFRLFRLLLLWIPFLVQFFAQIEETTGQSNQGRVIVRIWLRTYTYRYKLKANRDWCSPSNPNEPCSPAFHFCFLHNGASRNTCRAEVKFGGQRTNFANRNTVQFGTYMGKDVYNPMQFLLSKWEPYPSVNITITNDDFDVKQNLIAQTTLHMDKLYSPSPTKWRAKWNKVTLRLASDKMKIILSYQAYNVGSSKVDKQVIRLRDVSEEDEPVVEERIEERVQKSMFSHPGSIFPVIEPEPRLIDQPGLMYPIKDEPQSTSKHTTHSTSTPTIPDNTDQTDPPTEEYKNTTVSTSTATTMETTTPKVTTEKITTATTTTKTTTTETTTMTAKTTTEKTTTPTTTSKTTTTTKPITTTTSPPDHLSPAAISGLAIGLIALLIILIAVPLLCYKYRDRLAFGAEHLAFHEGFETKIWMGENIRANNETMILDATSKRR